MANIPNVRFKGFTEDWEQHKVKCFIDKGIIEVPMDGNHGEKHPTANEYVSDGIPFLMASDIYNGKADVYHCKYITKERASKLDKGFAKNGDVLITHKATIGEVAILQGLKTEYAVLTPQVTYYRIQDESRLNQKYLYAYFNSEEFQSDLKIKAAQSTRPYIGISAQQNLKIKFPIDVREQEQIGTFLTCLDNCITLHQRKCDEIKELKKYMLQKMFPQKGKKIPEIRFAGFIDDWELRKLDEVLERRKNQRKQSPDYPRLAFASGQGVIPLSERKTNNREQLTKDEFSKNYLVTEIDDIVYNPANVKYGAIDRNKCGRGLISPIYVTFTTKEVPSFIERIVTSNDFKQRALKFEEGTVTKRQSVNPEDLITLDITITSSREEQKQIGDFFDYLDHLITLYQRKCDELKEVKKFMLQNMFPKKG